YGLRCVVALRLPAAAHPALFADPGAWQGLLDRWESIAKRYHDAPELLSYDLLDHPTAPDTLPPEALTALGAARVSPAAARRPALPGATAARAWNALAAKLTNAIRAHDDRHTIVIQSHEASPAAFTHLRPTRDPNTLYSFHCFDPRAFTQQGLVGQEPIERGLGDQNAAGQVAPVPYPGTIDGERWDRARLQELLGPALEFRRVYEAPVYVGAFGVAGGAPRAGQLTWLRTVLSLCRAHGLGWAYWTYKGGPFGLAADRSSASADIRQERYGNPMGLDYDLLGILQGEA
ncbi:MAG: glycoside hydrolase family 5 protein, partial [Chloroflexota bacterium]|nr:glycoside hydrolase family 5 protein [Chloroflexota bacterium]